MWTVKLLKITKIIVTLNVISNIKIVYFIIFTNFFKLKNIRINLSVYLQLKALVNN